MASKRAALATNTDIWFKPNLGIVEVILRASPHMHACPVFIAGIVTESGGFT